MVHQGNAMSFQPSIPPITFTDEEFKGVNPSQDDPMVILVDIKKFTIMKTLVHQGSSVDILYWKTFKAMRILEAEMMSATSRVRRLVPKATSTFIPPSTRGRQAKR